MATRTAGRRERIRKATVAEIHAAARTLLIDKGSAAVTVNAVARQVGMSGPALYHYYDNHDALVGAVTAEFFDELTAVMEQARDAQADAPVGDRILVVCRAMRAWAVTHRAEFGWIFAAPISPANRNTDSGRHRAGRRFEQVLLELTVELWQTRPFPVPELGDLPGSLAEQLDTYSARTDHRLPPAAAHVFLTCWIRLYGLLCMEVLHQLDFAYSDCEPLYEQCLGEIGRALGLGDGSRG